MCLHEWLCIEVSKTYLNCFDWLADFNPAKHAIPKIVWAIELLYNSVETGSQWVGESELETRCVREKHYPAERTIGTPDWVGDQMSWWQDVVEKASRKLSPRISGWAALENKKDTTLMAIRVWVNILQFCSVSNSLSHTPALSNKVRGIFF